MAKLQSKKGFTLAEVLVAIAIIAILAAVAFIAVQSYMRSMTKLEYDEYAKEIFVAAQNHLSMAEHEGYLGNKSGFGTEETMMGDMSTMSADDGEASFPAEGVYVVVVENGASSNGGAVLDLMLPNGAIDGTVSGGSYIIRYQKDPALVLDVFYWSETANRFAHSYSAGDYARFMQDHSKETLRNYLPESERSVIGHYGAEDPTGMSRETLKAPSIQLINAERLYVKITNPNTSADVKIKLIITGVTSGKKREIDNITGETATVILDDITSSADHFAKKLCSGDNALIPGENITVQAAAYGGTTEIVVPAYSSKQTTNSLFADLKNGNTAVISNIRHLENLAKEISGVNQTGSSIQIQKADQTSDLDWNQFKSKINNNPDFTGRSFSAITYSGGGSAASGCFMPVNTGYRLTEYNGNSHTIKNVAVSGIANAGLFGTIYDSSTIKNLKLLDFSISGTATAGALAGVLDKATAENVVAYHSNRTEQKTDVTGAAAGGLVGQMNLGHLNYCAAALIVGNNTTSIAGGLVGKTEDSSQITGCYSGGHTEGGLYSEDADDFNVTGGTAGGLIGSGTGCSVTNSYSTCSVKGTSAAAGFIGSGTGTADNCYCTGLVEGTAVNAFAGSSISAANCFYLSIINSDDVDDASNAEAFDQPAGDTSATVNYQTFVGTTRGKSSPYDSTLNKYYKGKYSLKSIAQMDSGTPADALVRTHYGDWPAPEIFFVNVK